MRRRSAHFLHRAAARSIGKSLAQGARLDQGRGTSQVIFLRRGHAIQARELTPVVLTSHLAKRLELDSGTSSIGTCHWWHTRVVPHRPLAQLLTPSRTMFLGPSRSKETSSEAPRGETWRSKMCSMAGLSGSCLGLSDSASLAGLKSRCRGPPAVNRKSPCGFRMPCGSSGLSDLKGRAASKQPRAWWEKAGLSYRAKAPRDSHLPRLPASRSPHPNKSKKEV